MVPARLDAKKMVSVALAHSIAHRRQPGTLSEVVVTDDGQLMHEILDVQPDSVIEPSLQNLKVRQPLSCVDINGPGSELFKLPHNPPASVQLPNPALLPELIRG